jgi:cation-transporting ATPase E
VPYAELGARRRESPPAEPGRNDTGGALALEQPGLSAAEVRDRVARGLVNDVPGAPGRTYGQIVRANVLTRFNLLLGSLLVVILVVGRIQAHAARLAERARSFTLARSELRVAIDRIVAVVTWVLVPTAALLFATQIAAQHQDLRGALRGAVAGSVAMVPEGLVLLTSVTFAVSVIRLGRQQVLVQELPAVETLARVDVLCFDKTGTITAGDLSVRDLVPLGDGQQGQGHRKEPEALGAMAAADPSPNATLRAIAAAYPPPEGWTATKVVPFSSARKWSAASFDERGNFVLGVRTKVLSGDHPRTVAAVARRVGIPGADEPVDARSLPTDSTALAGLLERSSVFGRVVPDQKQAMVDAMHTRDHVVAMTGDGVNDVLALKDADLGIAMGNGSPASRAVAQLVLLSSRFATLPSVVAEGRRVIANIERVAKLFVTKTVYATALAVAVGIARLPFPFLPRQLTLIGSLTIGIPGFFLALEPNTRRARPDLLRRVVVFAVPAGVVAACATLLAYWLAHRSPSVPLEEARTTATMTLTGSGLWILWSLSRPLNPLRVTILLAMLGALVGVLAIPWLREQFALALPPAQALAGVGVLLAVVGVVIEVVAKRVG